MFRAVFFDMGGTILHSRDIPGIDFKSFDNVRKMLERHGIKVSTDMIAKAYEEAKKELRKRLPEFIEIDLAERWVETLRILDVTADRELAKECMDAFFSVRQGIGKVVYFEDFKPTVEMLRENGLKLGLISNVDYGIMYFVREIRLYEYFDTVVFSWQVKWKKPHPRIFQIALDRLKVKPEESIMVGDSLRADVKGAKNIGMTAVWINRSGNVVNVNELDVKPDYIIKSLKELEKIIRRKRV